MVGKTGIGWIASCADDPKSNWGSVEGFYRSIDQCEMSQGRLVVESDVWGTMNKSGLPPGRGDGFAFYHSTRALFPEGDTFKKRPRVSAVGELLDAQVDQTDRRCLESIRVAIDPKLLKRIKEHPIIRNHETRVVFEACGIVRGVAFTFYRVDKAAWRKLMALLPT